MKKILSAVVVAAALTFAGTAQAQFALDLKMAYAIPTGNVINGIALSNSTSGAIPFEVAGRYRFTPNLSAGLYFQWGPAFLKSSFCDVGLSCSASDMRLGVEVMYGFNPTGMNPWVSLGTGWEWSFASATAGGLSATSQTNGWEYFNIQTGIDFPLSKLFGLGPYVGYFGGSFTSWSATDSNGVYTSGTYGSGVAAFHGWFQIGAKGTFNF